MSKLKILTIVPWYFPATGFGGGIAAIHNILKRLVLMGNEVMILTTDAIAVGKFDRHIPSTDLISGIRIRRFPVTVAVKQFFFTPSMIGPALEQAYWADVIFAAGMRNFQTDLSVFVSKLSKKPVAIQGLASARVTSGYVSFSEPFFRLFHNGFTGNFEFKYASCYIATSKFEAELFKAAGVPNEKIYLSHSGVNLEDFENKNFKEEPNALAQREKNFIFFLGRIDAIKGIDVLLRAFQMLSKSRHDIRLVIAGTDQGYGTTMMSLISELNLDDKVTWVRDPDRRQVAELMKKCSMFVLPSYSEGNPIVIHEAGVYEKPVIASNVGGIPEIIRDGDNGILVSKGDATELYEKMALLSEVPELGEELGHHLREQVYSKYNTDVVAKKIGSLFDNLVRNQGRLALNG